jgi:hypothetical protein
MLDQDQSQWVVADVSDGNRRGHFGRRLLLKDRKEILGGEWDTIIRG